VDKGREDHGHSRSNRSAAAKLPRMTNANPLHFGGRCCACGGAGKVIDSTVGALEGGEVLLVEVICEEGGDMRSVTSLATPPMLRDATGMFSCKMFGSLETVIKGLK